MAECMLTRSSSNSGGGGGGGVSDVNGQTGSVWLTADDLAAISYGSQSLTTSQQANARANIGAAASANLPPIFKEGATSSRGGSSDTTVSGDYSFAYGLNCSASNSDFAFLFGDNCATYSDYSVTIGNHLYTMHPYEWAIGRYNQSNADTAFSFGNGTSYDAQHNLMELKTDGRLFLNGNPVAVLVTLTGYDATKTQTLKNISGTFTWVNDT